LQARGRRRDHAGGGEYDKLRDWYDAGWRAQPAIKDCQGSFRARRRFTERSSGGRGETPGSWHMVSQGCGLVGTQAGQAVAILSRKAKSRCGPRWRAYSPRRRIPEAGPTFCSARQTVQERVPSVRASDVMNRSEAEPLPPPGVERGSSRRSTDNTLRFRVPESGGARRRGARSGTADNNGDNVKELIVATEDGNVHAYEPTPRGQGLGPTTPCARSRPRAWRRTALQRRESSRPPCEPPRGPTGRLDRQSATGGRSSSRRSST